MDFVLKRIRPPQNYPRRMISRLANEVQANIYNANPPTAGAMVQPSAKAGFIFREKGSEFRTLYPLFFFVNLTLKALLYVPAVDWVASKMQPL